MPRPVIPWNKPGRSEYPLWLDSHLKYSFLLAYSTETFHVQPALFPETEKLRTPGTELFS